MVAVSYGLARYGYGLFVPEFRSSYGMSSASLGLLATASYLLYLASTAAVMAVATRVDARAPIAVGGCSAAIGMGCIGLSSSTPGLVAGVLLAGASAGFVLPPLFDVVKGVLAPPAADRAFAALSSGTGWGVIVAGPTALLAGAMWRSAWLAFACFAIVATVWALMEMPPRRLSQPSGGLDRSLVRSRRFLPILVAALGIGLGSSVYWTFAVDLVSSEGDRLPAVVPPMLLVVVGIASVLGSFGGDLLLRVGERRALVATASLLASSLCMLALGSSSVPAITVSGFVFGATYNLVVAMLSIAVVRVNPDSPSAGVGSMLFILGVGQLVGPVAAGVVGDAWGFPAAFYLGAAVIVVAAVVCQRRPGRAAGQKELANA